MRKLYPRKDRLASSHIQGKKGYRKYETEKETLRQEQVGRRRLISRVRTDIVKRRESKSQPRTDRLASSHINDEKAYRTSEAFELVSTWSCETTQIHL